MVRSHQIQSWENFPLKTWLEEQWNAPASLDNDTNVACLAEASFGAGRVLNSVFYIILGGGVSGGLVFQNRIYRDAIPAKPKSATFA